MHNSTLIQLEEQTARLVEDKDNKKAKEGFLEAARTLELMDISEVEGLAETMFKGMRHLL